MFKFLICIISLSLLYGVGIISAQETITPEATQMANLDEDIQPQDLGVGDPKILPDNPIYFLKNWARGIRTAITFNPIAKAELKLKFTNEKIIEIKKSAEKTANPEILIKALENYRGEINSLKTVAEGIKENTENPKVDRFLDKLIDQNIKQQKLLGKLEKELPNQVFEKLKEVKEDNLARFSDIATKIAVQTDVLKEKLNKAIEEQSGSRFKNFKNLEVLIALKEKVPEQAKDAIEKAQTNALKRLLGDLSQMSPQDREKFKDYIQNIGGNEIKHLEVLDNLETETITKEVRTLIEKAKGAALEKIENRIETLGESQKKVFLKPLEKGEINALRIVNELENNLDPSFSPEIIGMKKKVLDSFRKDIEAAETPEQREVILKKIEAVPDIKTFEVLEDIEGIIPPEKKEFFNEMRERTIEKMKGEIEKTKTFEERELKLESVSSDSPVATQILKNLPLPPEISTNLGKALEEKLERKIQLVEDPQKLQILKEKIESEGVSNLVPNALKKVGKKVEEKKGEVLPEKAKNQIGRAEELINKAVKQAQEKGAQEVQPVKSLLETAKKHLAQAKEALNQTQYGQAFGQATSAMRNAENALKAIENMGLKEQIQQERLEKFEKILGEIKEKQPEAVSKTSDFLPEVGNVMRCPLMPLRVCEKGKTIIEKTSAGCPIVKCVEEPVCIQVITPAISTGGICKNFPTPCDIPEGWKKVDKCPEEKQ